MVGIILAFLLGLLVGAIVIAACAAAERADDFAAWQSERAELEITIRDLKFDVYVLSRL